MQGDNSSPEKREIPLPEELARDPIIGTPAVAKAVNSSEVHVRRLVKAGKFPAPLKIGDRKNGWRLSTIQQFIQDREAAALNPVIGEGV